MIFVNYGCGGYEIFDHATWNGLHIADVIFPWFLWIMGVCIPISLTSSFKRGISKKAAIFVILRVSFKYDVNPYIKLKKQLFIHTLIVPILN